MFNKSENIALDPSREERIVLLQKAITDLFDNKTRLEEEMARSPVEVEFAEGHYRVLLDEPDHVSRLIEAVRTEIDRLKISANPMYDHMNLFFGTHSNS